MAVKERCPTCARSVDGNNALRFPGSEISAKTYQPRVVGDAPRDSIGVSVGAVISRGDSQRFTLGSVLFGALLFLAGSLPSSLPWVYVLFTLVCLPVRIVSFAKQKWTFFLIDFCYWANVAALVYLVAAPRNETFQTLVYALCDGPLAGALVVWQCAWVFGSSTHYISVMIHLLPGLALFAYKYTPGPKTLPELWQCGSSMWSELRAQHTLTEALQCWSAPATVSFAGVRHGLGWTFVAPMLFYGVWQFSYWLIVQVCFRDFIVRNKYDTSYRSLARRAAKTNNFWNQFVRRGSPARRVCMYGLLQAVFTVMTLVVFVFLYRSFYLSFLLQVVKFILPVWYGSRIQCEKVPQRAVVKALSQQDLHTIIQQGFPAAFDKHTSARASSVKEGKEE